MKVFTHDKAVHVPLNSQRQSNFVRPNSGGLTQLKKRGLDLLIASLVTIGVLSWLMPLLALLIKVTSPGPALYVQRRTGYKGRVFACLKFRTMTYQLNAPFQQATQHDVRITPIGRFLRKTNLDELPQFLNVLAGHMSLVGPRPHPLPLDAQYWHTLPGYPERYAIRPGITGLAQARGARGETKELYKMKIRLRYDQLYIRHQSTRLDTTICWWTLKAAIKGNKNAW